MTRRGAGPCIASPQLRSRIGARWCPRASLLAVWLVLAAAGGAPGQAATIRPLIIMQQVRPVTITPQSVTIDRDGEGSVIVVLGELTIPTPVRFRLSRFRLSHLRSLIASSGVARLDLDAPFTTRAMMYTVSVGNHSVRADQGHIPRRLRPLIVFLHDLIVEHY